MLVTSAHGWGFARLGVRRRGATAPTTPTPPATGTAGRQLLTGCLEHLIRIHAWTHHPHHDVVAAGGLLQQQGGVETHPAKHQLLLGIHRHGHQLVFEAARRRLGAGSGCGPRGLNGNEGLKAIHRRAGGFRQFAATTDAAAAAAAAARTALRGARTEHLSPSRRR